MGTKVDSFHTQRWIGNAAEIPTLGARTSTLGARTSTLGARTSTLGARTSTLGARTSTLGARTSTLGARTSTLGARTSTLDASALDAWRIDASTLGARTSTLDASALDAWRIDASTLGARTSTLDASALDAWRIDASTLGARTSTLDASALDAWRIDASTLGARTSTLDASALRRSVHAPRRSTLRRFGASTLRRSVHAPRRSALRRSTLRRFDARCTHLDASAFDDRRIDASTLSARTTMSGFHRCVTCQAKLPASDPHEDCVSCLGPDHAASALADRAYCQLCAGFQTRTLRQRARKAVGGRSPSSGSSHTISAPPSSAFTPPVAAQPPRSPSSQLTAGQRSPARRTCSVKNDRLAGTCFGR
ncbi:UNVERIFIED_CONTAM: hypothetical protein FKN15_055948 [Acipenser sinensis]